MVPNQPVDWIVKAELQLPVHYSQKSFKVFILHTICFCQFGFWLPWTWPPSSWHEPGDIELVGLVLQGAAAHGDHASVQVVYLFRQHSVKQWSTNVSNLFSLPLLLRMNQIHILKEIVKMFGCTEHKANNWSYWCINVC